MLPLLVLRNLEIAQSLNHNISELQQRSRQFHRLLVHRPYDPPTAVPKAKFAANRAGQADNARFTENPHP